MCMTGDDEYWDFYTEHTPRARQDHPCGECGRTIRKGERYHTQGGLNEGAFLWYKTCSHCDEASRWLSKVCDGWVFGRREEDFLEHVVGDETYVRSRPLVRLVRWMRADWTDRDGNLRPIEAVKALTNEAIVAYLDQYNREAAA